MLQSNFSSEIDRILTECFDLCEGTLLHVNRVVANAISIPEGDYRVLLSDNSGRDTCMLVPTSESSCRHPFEVHRPTLRGFYNPEIHKRIVNRPKDTTIAG